MQNSVALQEILSPSTLRDDKKMDAVSSPGGSNIDYQKHHRSSVTQSRENVECVIPRSGGEKRVHLTPEQPCRTIVNCNNLSAVNKYPLIGDKYVLLENVEGSSMYHCVDYITEELYVCKIVSYDCHSMVDAHYRLESSARVASLREVIMEEKYMYLIFSQTYGDLHSYVRSRKRLRESEARRLFKQIVETVEVCHEKGVVLRDLKLRKFVFTDPQRTQLRLESLEDAVVLDDSDNDQLHDKRGCPAYVSPEILKVGANYSGRAADMWSLGVILYTMLVGRYPFNDPDHTVLFAKITKGHFIIPDCISAKARCLIRSLLRKEPSERLTSEDISYHPWLVKEDKDWQSRACDQLVPESSMYDDQD